MNDNVPLAVATDFNGSGGDPEEALRQIAEAGFTHLHWCHQWNTDHLYSDWEIARIAGLLRRFGLKLLDIHGSDACAGGALRCWYATDESYRRAGVELVLNRLRMHAMLRGEGTLMMHVPGITPWNDTPEGREGVRPRVDALLRSLDEILPVARGLGIPLALENMPGDTWEVLDRLFDETPPDLVGLCYDSGHANIEVKGRPADGIEHLERHLDRLQALHLHDNDGSGDQHRPPFYGTVDWPRLVADIRRSAYPRMLSFELAMREPCPTEPAAFLADAHERCLRVAALPDPT
jgi:sugar phosphate isomerase/epimerase